MRNQFYAKNKCSSRDRGCQEKSWWRKERERARIRSRRRSGINTTGGAKSLRTVSLLQEPELIKGQREDRAHRGCGVVDRLDGCTTQGSPGTIDEQTAE